MKTDRCQINRVDIADLAYDSVRLAPDAGVFMREVATLANAYFGALDRREAVESLLVHLDPDGFKIQVLSPDHTLATADAYRDWHSSILATFSSLRHTVVALAPTLLADDKARAKLSIHSAVDLSTPAAGESPRANHTLDIIWDLSRMTDGRWVISGQHADPQPSPDFSVERMRQFAATYLDNLDRRNLAGMLNVLAPPLELNIALNGGHIIEDFPQWFHMIDDAFIHSKHRIQGLVAVANADGTIDAHLRIHFTADKRNPKPDEDQGVDFSVDRIWTIRPDADGRPQLVSQRPFTLFDLGTRVDPMDVKGALASVRRGDNEVVRDWLRNGGDPNAYAADGFTLSLAAAATGNTDALRMLLLEGVGTVQVDPGVTLRDPQHPVYDTGIVAPHLSAQKGDVASTLLLLSRTPEHLHTRMEVNGHTPLLQAAFYGHVDLARAIMAHLETILPPGADQEAERRRLFSETTVRGINATQFGRQFHNQAMIDALEPFDKATAEDKQADTIRLLEAIPSGPRHPEAGTPAQEASETVINMITNGLAEVAALEAPERTPATKRIIADLRKAVQQPAFDPNRLAGELLQTPIIAAVTGTNVNAEVGQLRSEIVRILLDKGADPDKEERYPMAVDAVIRAAVFNHFDCLKQFEAAMPAGAMKQALNHKPAVNGLTALHDSVLRAATGAAGYLEQIRWMRGLGASVDIADHTGRTQRDFAAAPS